MAVPNRLIRKLNEALGAEASDDMVNWIGETDTVGSELRRDVAQLRHEMNARFDAANARFDALQADIDGRFAATAASVDSKFAVLEAKMDARFAAAEAAAAQRHSEFMRWTMGFWAASLATMVASIFALARVIR